MTKFLTPSSVLPSYMMFPRFLLAEELNETTMLVYMALLNRARLSMERPDWTDQENHVFLYYPIKALAKTLHKSEMTIKNALSALEKAELIVRKRQGIGRPNRIYVKVPQTQTERKLSYGQKKIYPAERHNSVYATDNRLSTNKNNRSRTLRDYDYLEEESL